MKRNISLLCLSALLLVISCKDTEESHQQYMEQLKQEVFKDYSAVSSITVEVKESTVLDVTLVDVPLYNGSNAERKKTANEIGVKALRIFGKDNTLEKGTLMVNKDEQGNNTKTTEINLDSLRKTIPQ